MPDKLSTYHAKRDFRITAEPKGRVKQDKDELRFVVHRHDARNLHYDFRLEFGGTLKSWAIPKGPSLDPAQKRLAVQVEDHPVSYADFEGVIPEHQYGAGTVEIWDNGTWEPQGDPASGYRDGKLKFQLYGDRLNGGWTLIRTRMQGSGNQQQWLLIKERDDAAQSVSDDAATEQATVPAARKKSRPVALKSNTPASGGARRRQPAATKAGRAAYPHAADEAAADGGFHGVIITHPERVIDPTTGLTKFDLARYYDMVALHILPYLENRPVYLLRAPTGLTGRSFFQRHASRTAIPGIDILDPSVDPEHQPLMVINSARALISAAQMGTFELHTCNALADRIDRPDCMVFDLDPDPGLPWDAIVEGAQLTRQLLAELGLTSFLKTSGSKGLHIVVPLVRRHPWEAVTQFSEAVAYQLAQAHPDRFSVKMGEQNRVGKIYIDYLRNQKMASTVVPYSVRAKDGLSVATPIAWDELENVTGSAMWTITNFSTRLAQLKSDPWNAFWSTRQQLTKAMRSALGLS